MCGVGQSWLTRLKKIAGPDGHWLALAGVALLWLTPTKGYVPLILWVAGLYGLWNWRKLTAAWNNVAGWCFALGIVWAVASVAWSFYPMGSGRDLVKSLPMVAATMALPAIFDRPTRIWNALLVSAGVVSLKLALDLWRLWAALGWPALLTEARFYHPYLYNHPNVSSMMAGLAALVFGVRLLVGGQHRKWRALLVLGLLVDLLYLEVLASRGPQLVFALVVLSLPLALLPSKRVRAVAALLAVAIGVGLWCAAGSINPRFEDRTMKHYNDRDTIWGHSWLLITERPVLGYGFGKKAFEKAVYENPELRGPRVRFHYPHAHSYWLMVPFQGGFVALALWGAGWLALGGRLAYRMCRWTAQAPPAWRARVQVRLLPALLGAGVMFILVYGIGDYPDNAIRHAQFYLAGLIMALTRPAAPEADA